MCFVLYYLSLNIKIGLLGNRQAEFHIVFAANLFSGCLKVLCVAFAGNHPYRFSCIARKPPTYLYSELLCAVFVKYRIEKIFTLKT